METTSFVLGMLSIVAVAFMAVIVWGIVKINKLTFEMKATHEWIDNGTRDRDYNLQQVYRKFDETDRNISLEYERIYNQIAECRSYTDSRVDKILSTTGAKQLIKG
jgi:hypothetical protein